MTVKANPDTEQDDRLQIFMEGAISSGDVAATSALLSKYPKHRPSVFVDSGGGEIGAAIAIGRLLRARDAKVSVGSPPSKCLSSCVLIYAAGVERVNFAQGLEQGGIRTTTGTGIGIHRFYFSRVSATATTSEIQAARNKQKEYVRSYLSDMNVLTQLLDAMEATPPEMMKMLTVKQLHSFGLLDRDPVYDEKDVASKAAYFGLTSAEFRKRSVEAAAYCRNKGVPNRLGTKDVDFDALMSCEPDYIRLGRGSK